VVLVYTCVLLCGEKTPQAQFSASDVPIQIVLGSIPIKCPGMALARSALSHLDSALRLFEDVAHNSRAIKVLVGLEAVMGIHQTNDNYSSPSCESKKSALSRPCPNFT
jgi:hypothetical protein